MSDQREREKNREYMREYRARKRGTATVTALPEVERVPGPVEQGVLDDVAGLSTAASNRALVAAALALARILDDHRLATTQPSAAGKLESIMASLKRGADSRQGRLARVQSMTARVG